MGGGVGAFISAQLLVALHVPYTVLAFPVSTELR